MGRMKYLTRQINSDCQTLRRFAIQHLATGYLQCWGKKKGDRDDQELRNGQKRA